MRLTNKNVAQWIWDETLKTENPQLTWDNIIDILTSNGKLEETIVNGLKKIDPEDSISMIENIIDDPSIDVYELINMDLETPAKAKKELIASIKKQLANKNEAELTEIKQKI